MRELCGSFAERAGPHLPTLSGLGNSLARVATTWVPNRLSLPFLFKGGPIGLQLRTTFSPAHPLARRDVPLSQTRAFQFPQPFSKGSGQGCPLLRASNEHILIVRVLRARRAPGRSLLGLHRAG
jgi:hypothetical protein